MKRLLFLFAVVLLSCNKEDQPDNCWECTMSTIRYGEKDSSGAHTFWYETYNIETICDVSAMWINSFEEGRTVIGYSKCECERK